MIPARKEFRVLDELTPAQLELEEYMSELSEEAYCAAWMDGLEFALWEVIRSERATYGRLVMSGEQRMRLQTLSDACGGWIVFDDETEETWIPRADWERRFEVWLQQGLHHDL